MNCTRTQGFYENAANAYPKIGMKGHGGIDVNCGYGTEVQFPLDGLVSGVFNNVFKASDGYWGVYALCEYKGQLGELCVGHLSRIDVKIGDKIRKGQVVGLEGNHGYVFDNGVQITLAQQAAGDQRGHHRHWQWRPVVKTKSLSNKQFITNYTGIYKDSEGYYYQVLDYDNGFHGLSPDIAGILNDFTEVKPAEQPTPEQLSTLSKALNVLSQLIKNLFANKKTT